jgi:UDP:flavonoid glycosyltransferase YjiC (YdhE family)
MATSGEYGGTGVRVLLASTDGAGHFGPLRPFIDALAARGDELLLVVPPKLEAIVSALGQPFVVSAEPPAEELSALWERFSAASGREAAVLGNRELFGRLWTAALLPTAERACRDWSPQLVLHEAAEYASAIAAERCGVPHAQVAISLAEVEAGSLELAAPALNEHDEHIAQRLHASPYLTRLPASLDPSPYPATERFREAAPPPRAALAQQWGRSDAPLVYVTFGSVAGGLLHAAALYRTALDAVAGLRARVLLTVGRDIDIDTLGPVPDNARVEPWVPQAEVLADAALVVAHGGSGTTFGTLAAGVPLVIVPLFADQLANAERVAAAGAAVVVEPRRDADRGMGTLGPEHVPRLRAAIETSLADPSYARAARRIADEMAALPSIDDLPARLIRAQR